MGTPSQGSQAKMCWDSVLPIDTSSKPLEFVSENLRKVGTHIQSGGIRGTRSRSKERVRLGPYKCTGSITLHPSPTELDFLLPCILGTAESADVFALAETLPVFQIMVDRIAKCFTYNECRVNRATFSGSVGSALQLVLDIEAETETIAAAGSFPALTFDLDTMFVMTDGALVLGVDASATQFASFEVVIDNFLDTERFMNATTRAEIAPQDRAIFLNLGMAYTPDEVDVNDQAVAGSTGTLTFTNGGQSLLFTFANLKAPAESPVVSGKSEILLPVRFEAYKSGSTEPLVVTHDAAA